MALGLGLVAGTRNYAQSSRSQSQGEGSPVQEPTQPAQPQQPTKSPDENSNKNTQDQFPTPPVVAGTSNEYPRPGAPQPVICLFAACRYGIPTVFFFGSFCSNCYHTCSNSFGHLFARTKPTHGCHS